MCEPCRTGATGRHGHAALKEYFCSGVQADGRPEYVLFLCRACGATWRRRERGNETFEWAKTGAGSDAPA